jgi:hypothetical protein
MTYRFVEATKETPNATGHFSECGYPLGQYKMPATWIDTDNQVWEEPYHLYTELEANND